MDEQRPLPLAPPPVLERPDPRKLVLEAMRALLGKPYVWGAKGPDAFDCSGAVCAAMEAAQLVPAGFRRTHNADLLYRQLAHVEALAAQPGDLVFYGSPKHVDHVCMLAAPGRVLGAIGGGRHCATVEEAHRIGACVQERALGYRLDVVGFGALPSP